MCWVSTQAQEARLQSEQELIITLWRVGKENPNEVTLVLKANRQLVTADLWRQFKDLAATRYYENSNDAFVLYDVARQVAVLISNQELLARTFYDVARSYLGLREYEKAKAAYLDSYRAFLAAGLSRDAIYILSDLGTISLIKEQYEEAKDYSERAVKLAESLHSSNIRPGAWPDSFGEAASLRTLAALSLRDGNPDLAIEQLQKVLNLLTK